MEHELSGGALGVDPRGDDPHLRDLSAPMAAPPVAIGINSFRALDVGVQEKREPRQCPLAPGPRHHLMGHGGRAVSSAGAGLAPLKEPFPSPLRRTGGSEPSQQDGARTGKKEKQEGMDRKGARRSVLMAGEGQPPTSTIVGNDNPFCM